MSLLSTSAGCLLLPGRALMRHGGRAVEASLGEGWDGALASLEQCLKQAAPTARLGVGLSHHFAALHLVEAPPVRLGGEEMQGWLQDRLARDFGAEAEHWRLAWQDVPPGRSVPVASMAAGQFDLLAGMLAGHGVKMRSLTPWFVQAWDRRQGGFARGTGWLALAEPGRLALGRLEKGRLKALAMARLEGEAGAMPAQIAAAVGRQALHLGVDPVADVWLLAPEGQADWSQQPGQPQYRPLAGNGGGWGGLLP